MDTLQKTFQDVIQTARALEIFYIWIDSLFIIQSGENSKEDWEKQAAAMTEIYYNCTLNISANHAANAEEGCFVSRDVELLNSVYFKMKDRCHGVVDGNFVLVNEDTDYIFVDKDIYMQLFTTPLAQRGWVVQERLLSPRVLHFGRDQIYWECQGMSFASEIFPGDLKTWESNIDKVPFNIEIPKIRGASEAVKWSKIVSQYSKCSLSFPLKGKFIALGAIAERAFSIYNEEYAAGLFKDKLPRSLLWRVAGTGEHPASVSTGDYRAPSWSWMNIDGPVDVSDVPGGSFAPMFSSAALGMEDIFSAGDPHWNYATVKDLQIELINPDNKFGPIKSARIILEGRLLSDAFMKELHQCWQGACATKEDGDKGITMISAMDSPTPNGEMPMLFPFGRNCDYTIHGLFLKQEGDVCEEVYSRLGYFRIHIGYHNPWGDRMTELLGEEKTIALI
jgi:hypothetical protein